MRRCQAAIEYLFMVALSLVVILIAIKLFLRHREGEAMKTGQTIDATASNIASNINSMSNSP